MKPLITWLHLSDIHFGHGSVSHGWDQQLVLSSLLKDLARMRTLAPPPELVLMTGDIAFSGASRLREGQTKSTEYQEAAQWLQHLADELGLSPQRIFPVPGNHDVQRSADGDPAIATLVENIREGRMELDAALADPARRALLARRQANYLAWAARFAPACLRPAAPPEERLFWTYRLEVAEGLLLRLVGLNTALLSANEEDQGKLRLGKEQLVRALLRPPPEDHEIVLILSHHPLRSQWVADEEHAEAWLRNHAHLHLSGHVHEADSEQFRSGAGEQFVRIAAGATHGEQMPGGVSAGHGYNVAALFLSEGGQLVLRVWPRRWSNKNKAFRPDQENIPPDQDYAEHPLKELTVGPKPSPRPSAVTLTPTAGTPIVSMDQQIASLHGALLSALQSPGLDDNTLVLLSNTGIKLKNLILSAPQHMPQLLMLQMEWENQIEARVTPEASPEIRRLFDEHEQWITEALNATVNRHGRESEATDVDGPYSFYDMLSLDLPRGLKLLLGRDELDESEGVEWLLAGGFHAGAARLEKIKAAGKLDAVFDVLWRRLPRIRLYHPTSFEPLMDYMRWSNKSRWEARMAKVKLCCSKETRREDAEALLSSVDKADSDVLAACLLTHPRKECRSLALEVLPKTERWDTLLCPRIHFLIIHELLSKILQDCRSDYIKVAFLLLRPRLAAVTAPLDIKYCFDIMKLFYHVPLFMEDTFFKALESLYSVVAARASSSSLTEGIARSVMESFKAFFSRPPVEDAKVSNLWSIPLPIQRKLAHEGHFIEFFICSTRDPIAFETTPHVMRSENAVSFFRINAINGNVLDYLVMEKKLNTQYPIRLAFCKNPKAKAPFLIKFIPTLRRYDLKALSQDKMASGFAREHASRLLAAWS